MNTFDHYDLDSLWGRLPKSSGFRLVIPDPKEIATWVAETCAYQGDNPASVVRAENAAALTLFRLRLSRRMVSGQRVWAQPFEDDPLIASIEIAMRAAYSPTHGEWCDIVAFPSLAPAALAKGLHWSLARKTGDIVARLRHCGLDARSCPGEDRSQGLLVAPPTGSSRFEACLGFETRAEALAADFETYRQPEFESGAIFAFNDSLALSPPEMIKDLQHFQVSFSYLVDSLYIATDQQPPDVVMVLSVLTEVA